MNTLLLALTTLALAAPLADAPGDDRDAIEAELDTIRAEPRTAQRLAQEARLLHYLAEIAASDQERGTLHTQGLLAAEAALAIDRDEPAAILWWAAHRGSLVSPSNPIAAVRAAAEIEAELLRLRELAPGYDHAAADRVLGVLYRRAPPVVSVGSMKKAEEHLRAALRRDPAYPGNQLFWAELLAQKHECRVARDGAKLVLGSPALRRFPLEAPGWARQARAVLDHCG
jgi:TRAP transporter T-component